MDVTTYISRQKPACQGHLLSLRKLILDAAPAIEEHIKYGVPFYTYRGPLCYLNVSKGVVKLGFCRGAEMEQSNAWLSGLGKQVRHVSLAPTAVLPVTAVRELLQEALLLNEWHTQHKRKSIKR